MKQRSRQMEANLVLVSGDLADYSNRIEEALLGVMVGGGPNVVALGRRDIDSALSETIWNDNEAGTANVRLMNDTDIPSQWVAVQADEQAAFDSILESIREALPVETYEALRDSAATPQRGGLTRLALTHDARLAADIVPLVTEALQSTDVARREDAIMAAQLTGDGGTLQPLREALEREQDAGAAEMLAHALKKIEAGRAG